MDFLPDPDKFLQSIDRVRDAFRAAADANTGSAQRHFQRLSDKFNATLDKAMDLAAENPNPKKIMMTLMPAVMDIQLAVTMIQREAANNPAAAAVFGELQETIKEEMSSLIPDLGALPGFPGLSNLPGFGNKPATPPAPPSQDDAANKPKPTFKKPGKGGFKL